MLKKKLILNYLAATFLTVILVGFAILKSIESLSIDTIEQQLIDQSNLAEIYITQIHSLQNNESEGLSKETAERVITKLGLVLGHIRLYDNNRSLIASSHDDEIKADDANNKQALVEAQKGKYAYYIRNNMAYFVSPLMVDEAVIGLLELIYPIHFYKNLFDGVTTILLIGVILFIFIMAFLSTSIAERLTKPINQLAKAANEFANRNFKPVEIKSSDEIGQLANSFNTMGNQLEYFIERQKRFVSNVSHELRTPLTAIMGYSEILKDEIGGHPELAKPVHHLNNEAKRLSQLVDEVLTLSRIDSDREELHFQQINLSELVNEIMDRMRSRAERYGIQLVPAIDSSIYVKGDKEKLIQVLVNLLDNAFKFSPSNTSVWINLNSNEGSAILSVIDQGIGIAEKEATKVFERFYRSENARGIAGTGLGLSITKFIIDAHNGTIELKQGDQRGTKAIITIPLS